MTDNPENQESPENTAHPSAFHMNAEEAETHMPYLNTVHLSGFQVAKMLTNMDFYQEQVLVHHLAEHLEQKVREIGCADDHTLQCMMGMQAVSLDALYHFSLNKFVSQKQDEDKPQDMRLVRYALMAQNQFMNTAYTLKERRKFRDRYDPFAPFNR